MSLLLDQLGVLQPHDQLQLLLFHASHLLLIQCLLRRLAINLILDLLPCAVLLLHEVELALSSGFMLLMLDHVLDL